MNLSIQVASIVCTQYLQFLSMKGIRKTFTHTSHAYNSIKVFTTFEHNKMSAQVSKLSAGLVQLFLQTWNRGAHKYFNISHRKGKHQTMKHEYLPVLKSVVWNISAWLGIGGEADRTTMLAFHQKH